MSSFWGGEQGPDKIMTQRDLLQDIIEGKFNFDNLPLEFRKDEATAKRTALELVSRDGAVLKDLTKFQKDEEVALKAIETNILAVGYVAPELLNQSEFIKKMGAINPNLLEKVKIKAVAGSNLEVPVWQTIVKSAREMEARLQEQAKQAIENT